MTMRVIDADEALQRCDNDIETMKARIEGKVPFQVGAAMVSAAKELRTNLKEYLDRTPTLDYEPVRHGEWKETGCNTFCRSCGEKPLYDYFGKIKLSHYCPNCGAKMDARMYGGKDNEHGV